jgi:hypothetical protein
MSPFLPAVLSIVTLFQPATQPPAATQLVGTWTMVPERSESPDQTPPVTSLTFNITQTGDTLNVEAIRNGNKSLTSYRIEAKPNPTPGTTGTGPNSARAYWEGDRLVTEHAGNVQGETVSIKEVFGVNADGSEMTVETQVIVQHGYTLRGARNYASKKEVFTKRQ